MIGCGMILWHVRCGTIKCTTVAQSADFQVLSLYHHINMSSMHQKQVINSSDDDDEHEPEGPPPPRKTFRKPQEDLSNNIELRKRTHGASEHTLSAKQQAISKYFHCVLYVLADITFR